MKEIRDIISSYAKATATGKRAALATVVHVEGSSYRRPGARMLVTDDGQLTGAISGGCLEGDALRKALLAISQGCNKLVTYDTSDEDDAKFGIQLGCNGIVHILFEPVDSTSDSNPLHLLEKLAGQTGGATLVTVFSLGTGIQPGTSYLYAAGSGAGPLDRDLYSILADDIRESFDSQVSLFRSNTSGSLQGFIEYVPPPVSLLVAGAGNDILPLVRITEMLGWDTTVIDGRPTHASRQRFPGVQDLRVVKMDRLPEIKCKPGSVALLMSHNYNYDYTLLKYLLTQDPGYIGVLGPASKFRRMCDQMANEGFEPGVDQLNKVFAPMGIDIGAETAEEIAISVVAEIKAVLGRTEIRSLREKPTPIHHRTTPDNG